MSGGSFNYLCGKDSTDILNHLDDLKDMLTTLKNYKLENSKKVELSFELLIQKIYSIKDIQYEIDILIEKLYNVMHDIEWTESNDSSIEEVKNSIISFNEKNWE